MITDTLQLIKSLKQKYDAATTEIEKDEIAKEHDKMLRIYKGELKDAHEQKLRASGYGAITVAWRKSQPTKTRLLVLHGQKDIKRQWKTIGEKWGTMIVGGVFEFKPVSAAKAAMMEKFENTDGRIFSADIHTMIDALLELPGLGGYNAIVRPSKPKRSRRRKAA